LMRSNNAAAAAAAITPYTDDIVLFHPPDKLLDIVHQSGGRITDRDLFIKRIAAQPGDTWSVTKLGQVQVLNNDNLSAEQQKQQQQPMSRRLRRDLCTTEPLRLIIERYIQPHDAVLVQSEQAVVLGDCESVSIDSRVWGPLSTRDIVGRPLLRIWPISRIGPIAALPMQPLSSQSLSSSTKIPGTLMTSITMDADWSN
jgi:signal peptidase I